MNLNNDITLLIPEKTDPEFEDVFAAWMKRGGHIQRLGKYWIKDEALALRPLAVYGNQAFAFVLEQVYGLRLVSPDDAIIATLDQQWTKRAIVLTQIDELHADDFPVFIKPVIPKLFLAAVFEDMDSFQRVTHGLPGNEQIMMSSIVPDIEAEARSFVLDGQMRDMALYEGSKDLEDGRHFLERFLQNHKQALPETVVVDLAYSASLGWFILEFNACWGAGLNGCSAAAVMDCIVRATQKA